MTPVDRVSLLQQDFSQFVCSSFRDLQADRDFSDVTLVCEDNHQVRPQAGAGRLSMDISMDIKQKCRFTSIYIILD